MYEDKIGLWLDKTDNIEATKLILEVTYNLNLDQIETLDEAIEKIENNNYDYFILEPTVIAKQDWSNLRAVTKPFCEKILNKLMEDQTKPIILTTTLPEIWRGYKLAKNVAVICAPTSAQEIIDVLNILFKKCRPS